MRGSGSVPNVTDPQNWLKISVSNPQCSQRGPEPEVFVNAAPDMVPDLGFTITLEKTKHPRSTTALIGLRF
jgi:hypothetical protein